LDTIVGERGMLVSGGERQRLALARALLREPELLILDEATSAIDVDGERTLLRRVRDCLPATTILLIAHRRESLEQCERVLTLDRGGLVADASLASDKKGRPNRERPTGALQQA
jgi:ATP-binding cassette subfamily C protein